MSDELRSLFAGDLVFNGINAVTGNYGQLPLSPQKLARLIRGVPSPHDYREFVDNQRLLGGLAEVQDRLTRVTDAQVALRVAEEAKRREELQRKASEWAGYPVKPGAGDPGKSYGCGVGSHLPSGHAPPIA